MSPANDRGGRRWRTGQTGRGDERRGRNGMREWFRDEWRTVEEVREDERRERRERKRD